VPASRCGLAVPAPSTPSTSVRTPGTPKVSTARELPSFQHACQPSIPVPGEASPTQLVPVQARQQTSPLMVCSPQRTTVFSVPDDSIPGALIERSSVVDQLAERLAEAHQTVTDGLHKVPVVEDLHRAGGISELPTETSSTPTASNLPTPSNNASTPSSATTNGTVPPGSGTEHVQEPPVLVATVEEVANEVLRLRLQKTQHEELRAQMARAEAQVRRLTPHAVLEFRSFLERHFREPTLPSPVQEALAKLVECVCTVSRLDICTSSPEGLLGGVRKMLRNPHSFHHRLCATPSMSVEEAKSLAPILLITTQFKRVREKEVNECYEAVHGWLSAFYLLSVASDQVVATGLELERQEALLRSLTAQNAEDSQAMPRAGIKVGGGTASVPSARGPVTSPVSARRGVASPSPRTCGRKSYGEGPFVASRSPSPGLPGGGARVRHGHRGVIHAGVGAPPCAGRCSPSQRPLSPSRARKGLVNPTLGGVAVVDTVQSGVSISTRGRSRGASLTRQQSVDQQSRGASQERTRVQAVTNPPLASMGPVSTVPTTPSMSACTRRLVTTPKTGPTCRRAATIERKVPDNSVPGFAWNRSLRSGGSLCPQRLTMDAKEGSPSGTGLPVPGSATAAVAAARAARAQGHTTTAHNPAVTGSSTIDVLGHQRSSPRRHISLQRSGMSPSPGRQPSPTTQANALPSQEKRKTMDRSDLCALDITPRSYGSSVGDLTSMDSDSEDDEEVVDPLGGPSRRVLLPQEYKALLRCAQQIVASACTGAPIPVGPDDEVL